MAKNTNRDYLIIVDVKSSTYYKKAINTTGGKYLDFKEVI